MRVQVIVCRLCGIEKPVEAFAIIKERLKSPRRDHRCIACIESIPLDEIYERDGGMCGLCPNHVPRKHASLDHIIPISKGGRHTRENVQLAHRRCNFTKGNMAPWEATHFARS